MTISTPLMKNAVEPVSRKEVGNAGEDYATSYLRDLGWTILDRNWSCRYGELDIVASCPDPQVPQKRIIVFVEVKTRQTSAYGDPLEAITPRKIQHLRRAGINWLASHQDLLQPYPTLVRFDAIAIVMAHGKVTKLTHVRRIA